MAEGRDSKKSHEEILATELVRLNVPFWRELAAKPAAAATPAATANKMPSIVWIGGAAAVALIFLLRR